MSESVTEAQDAPVESMPRKRRSVFNLQNMLLLVAAIGVWTSWWFKQQDIARLKARIAVMRPIARELEVDDPKKFAVVQLDAHWSDDHQWDVHVPDGKFDLCIATRGIKEANVPIKATARVSIPPGRHRLSLDQVETDKGWRVSVRQDGNEILGVDEPKEWRTSTGSSTVSGYAKSTQLPTEKPMMLMHRRFTKTGANRNVWNIQLEEGVVLWIVPEGQ